MNANFYGAKSSKLLLAIFLIIGLVVGGVVGYWASTVLQESSYNVQEISLVDASIKETGNTQLKIPIANNDADKGHYYTVTFQTDSSLSVYIGDTLLPRTDNIYSHTFYLDSRDSVTKNYIIRVGMLPETTTSISYNIAVNVYVDTDSEPLTQRNIEITVTK